jgi:tetratricopeptide (TPR) repeat protein
MSSLPSSPRARRASSRARLRLVVIVCALATLLSAAVLRESRAATNDPIQIARFSEENLPAQDLPSVVATPAASPAADWVAVPNGSQSTGAGPILPAAAASTSAAPLPAETNAAQIEPTPIATPTDVAPLEVGSIAPQGEISDSPLDGAIQSIREAQPALAASLRITDQAREEILKHQEADAIQTLTRAISVDGSNPYAYFYLGRAYLGKKNYTQAITFLNRAETHFGGNPQWLGETLAFEGLANEQAGDTAPAIGCYQKALTAVPGNLMARVGLTRLTGEQAAPGVQPAAEPSQAVDAPAPEGAAIPPPPDSPPPPPANASASEPTL